ncbi:hypothetical protein D915_007783 [Fasciola hepatica]|uniref:Uncharacterized protein n=1 Tax=Fasciola hepatica TaxID=6192 RepID=A0A2H1BY01_FASHE|nr:hypothetical protein D915_007783 [Fasciola hepatica]
MPPKKKIGNGIAKKSKNNIVKLTPNEMILDYRLGLTRSHLMELEFRRAKLIEEINRKEVKMNDLAKQNEKELREILDKWKVFNKSEENGLTSTEVVEYMRTNWKIKDEEQQRLRSIEEQIKETRASSEDTLEQIEHWKYFEAKTLPSNNEFITILRQEINSMKDRYDSFVENISRAFTSNKSKYFEKFVTKLETIRKDSITTAIRKVENHHWEIVEREEWFRKELIILKEREEELTQKIAGFENANIAICNNIARARLNPVLWPNEIPENFPNDRDELHHSHVLDLDLPTYFNQLELGFGKSSVDDVSIPGPDKAIVTVALNRDKYQVSKPERSPIEVKEALLTQNVDSLLSNLTDYNRWDKLMAIRTEEAQLLYVQGLSPRPISPSIG